MGRKSRFTLEDKLKYIQICKEGKDSIKHTARMAGVDPKTIRRWINNYQSLGCDGLNTTTKNSTYTAELKEIAVRDYLDGTGSLLEICKKYGIRSESQLWNWIKKYNSHEVLKTSGTGGRLLMTNGRKTTYEERVEVVRYCLEHDKNYAKAAEKYQVSYQQVYTWVKKYEEGGINALLDKRGKRKEENEMSELERLKAENKLLEAEIRRKQMEIDFLKKLSEIEGRRY